MVQSVQSMSLSVTPAQTAAWRRQIFEQLSERTKREMDNFKHYEQAIEQVHAIQEHLFNYVSLCGVSILPPSFIYHELIHSSV